MNHEVPKDCPTLLNFAGLHKTEVGPTPSSKALLKLQLSQLYWHRGYLVSTYEMFYNEVRPHQTLDNRPLTGKWPAVDDPFTEGEKIVCHEKLGGLLRHYERVAA